MSSLSPPPSRVFPFKAVMLLSSLSQFSLFYPLLSTPLVFSLSISPFLLPPPSPFLSCHLFSFLPPFVSFSVLLFTLLLSPSTNFVGFLFPRLLSSPSLSPFFFLHFYLLLIFSYYFMISCFFLSSSSPIYSFWVRFMSSFLVLSSLLSSPPVFSFPLFFSPLLSFRVLFF